VFYCHQPFLVGWAGWDFSCFYRGKTVFGWFSWSTFSTGLKPGWNGWKAFAWLCRVIVARVRTIPRSFRVSTENGWKSVLLRNVNRINQNRLRLKWLIPIEHDLCSYSSKRWLRTSHNVCPVDCTKQANANAAKEVIFVITILLVRSHSCGLLNFIFCKPIGCEQITCVFVE